MRKLWVLGNVNGDIYDQEVGTAVASRRPNVPHKHTACHLLANCRNLSSVLVDPWTSRLMPKWLMKWKEVACIYDECMYFFKIIFTACSITYCNTTCFRYHIHVYSIYILSYYTLSSVLFIFLDYLDLVLKWPYCYMARVYGVIISFYSWWLRTLIMHRLGFYSFS